MALTLPTREEVRAVYPTALTDGQLDAMIADAALIAEGCVAVATYTTARQASIVKWVAAHLLASLGGALGSITQKALGDGSETYARGQFGANLAGTLQGQQAIALDPSGCLARLGQRKAFVKVL